MAAMMGRIVVNTENEEVFIVKDDEKTVYMMKKDDLNTAEKPDVQKVEKLEGKKDFPFFRLHPQVTESNLKGIPKFSIINFPRPYWSGKHSQFSIFQTHMRSFACP